MGLSASPLHHPLYLVSVTGDGICRLMTIPQEKNPFISPSLLNPPVNTSISMRFNKTLWGTTRMRMCHMITRMGYICRQCNLKGLRGGVSEPEVKQCGK